MVWDEGDVCREGEVGPRGERVEEEGGGLRAGEVGRGREGDDEVEREGLVGVEACAPRSSDEALDPRVGLEGEGSVTE